jgi:hypothetical protein
VLGEMIQVSKSGRHSGLGRSRETRERVTIKRFGLPRRSVPLAVFPSARHLSANFS